MLIPSLVFSHQHLVPRVTINFLAQSLILQYSQLGKERAPNLNNFVSNGLMVSVWCELPGWCYTPREKGRKPPREAPSWCPQWWPPWRSWSLRVSLTYLMTYAGRDCCSIIMRIRYDGWRPPFLLCSCRERLRQSPGRPALWWPRMWSWTLGLRGLITNNEGEKYFTIIFSSNLLLLRVEGDWGTASHEDWSAHRMLGNCCFCSASSWPNTINKELKRENLPENFDNFVPHVCPG